MEQAVLAPFLGILVSSLAAIILFAGVSKLFYLKEFRASLLFVPYLPLVMMSPLAVAVPILEIGAGASLLIGKATGVVLTCVLLVTTALVALVASVRKQRIPCVCFTAASGETLSAATAARNLILSTIALSPLLLPVTLIDTEPFVPLYGVATIFVYLCVNAVRRNAQTMAAAEAPV